MATPDDPSAAPVPSAPPPVTPPAPTPAFVAPPPLAPVHDFARKLRQAAFLPAVRAYVDWRRAALAAQARGEAPPPFPPLAPLSLNLDLTTACNFACAHCVDWDILNRGISFDEARLRTSLSAMAAAGLRSVILIGGGEPTVHPRFVPTVRFLKELGLKVAIASNGSRAGRIHEVADSLDAGDWVRLSLDAGTDATFQAMHRPRKPVTLGEICAWVPRIRARNPAPPVGFSFVVTWEGAARTGGETVVANLHEIVPAARLARDSGFSYVSYKPFLVRTPEGAESIDPAASGGARGEHGDVVRRIRAAVDEAKTLATPTFAVLESTNLKLLESGAWRAWTAQPRTCHVQVFRQVLSPLGTWNCPAHRGNEGAKVGGPDLWAGADAGRVAAEATARRIEAFDARETCREVTCLYHDANHWLERAVADPRGLDGFAEAAGEDLFL